MEYIRSNLCLEEPLIPINPKKGAFFEHKGEYFVTLYNSVIDTYGIYKVDKDWSHYYWVPPDSYIYPTIRWELIWKEMDYCAYGYLRTYFYSETENGPEIQFYQSNL